MSRIACAWAELGEDANDAYHWYETTHIPDALVKIRSTARHAEQVEDSPFQEVPGIDGRFMTIYDLPKQPSAQDLDARICPALDKLPNEAKVDTRFYTEHKNWFGEEWRGDPRDVQMWVVVLWQPAPEVHDEFVKWFGEEFTPGMLESPGLLRTRIFKLEHASLIQDEEYKQVDNASVYQYMTFWEFDSEELPWEILVYLGSSERWRHYVEGGLLSWQVGQFLVNNIYPDIEDADSPAVMGAKIIEYQDLDDDISQHSGSDLLDGGNEAVPVTNSGFDDLIEDVD